MSSKVAGVDKISASKLRAKCMKECYCWNKSDSYIEWLNFIVISTYRSYTQVCWRSISDLYSTGKYIIYSAEHLAPTAENLDYDVSNISVLPATGFVLERSIEVKWKRKLSSYSLKFLLIWSCIGIVNVSISCPCECQKFERSFERKVAVLATIKDF